MIFYDSETVGLVGPTVLMQYAEDDGPITLHEVFHEPIHKTLSLIEYVVARPVCVYNLIFDWFHLTKLYNICRLLSDSGYNDVPTVAAFAEVEAANPSTYCLRAKAHLDLMLHVRKGPFQHTMNRKPIVLRRVPTEVANELADELTRRIKLPSICFAKKPYEWKVEPRDGEPFSDIKLTFASSSSLSAVCEALFGEKKTEFPVPKEWQPTELSWLPYGQYGKKPWKQVISQHIGMWHSNPTARYYAERDIELLRRLYISCGRPNPGDVDSELAASLGAARWRGFSIDHSRLRLLKEKYVEASKAHPRGAKQAKEYIGQTLSLTERATFKSTSRAVLELIAQGGNTTAAERARGVLESRKARLRLTLVDKLLKLPSYHPDFRVIGAKSNRMSGGSEDKSKGGSINPQGIPAESEFRECFTLAYPNEVLEGGDAVSYEVTIVDAVCKCPRLHDELKSGKSFHGLMGNIWYGITYEEVMASKGSGSDSIYDRTKKADFAWFYQAQAPKLASVLNLLEEDVNASNDRMRELYPEVVERRMSTAKSFCSMRQVGGIGSAIEWHEPADYIESIFGFRRYFTLENSICRELYKLAERPPQFVTSAKGKIVRRTERGVQTVGGATRSAIFATAFAIQQANMRAACNHEIQSPGGHMTKMFQLRFWQEQPKGAAPFKVRTINVHDEVLVVHDGTVNCNRVRERFLEEFRAYVPLLDWTWEVMNHWKK